MTVVVKLGSSIVADDAGELRADVLDWVCGQVAELHGGGEDVVLVTSGAIARGMRLMGLRRAPAGDRRAPGGFGGRAGLALPRLRGAARRQRGPRRAGAADRRSTSSARMHYLNARQTLRRLLDWRAVPVVNENDTTATDEITFGDNDFLSAQVAILLEARLLVLLTDTPGLHTADPRADPEAQLIEEVDDFAELRDYEIGDRTSAFGSGRHAQQGRGGGDGERGRDPGGRLRRDGAGHARGRRRGERVGTRFAPHRSGRRASSSGCATRSRPGAGGRRRGRGAGPARAGLEPAAGRDHRGRGRLRGRRRGRGGLRRRAGRQGDRQLQGERVGTRFTAHPERTPSFKLWLRYAKPSQGRVVVDEGAARVLRERGSSLLPVGITQVEGEFAAGDAVEVVCDGEVVGKGIVNYSAAELARIKGLKSAQVQERIPTPPRRPCIGIISC